VIDLDDIVGDAPIGDWLVIGWFTPDYRPLAETFSANLAEHGIPFHLFARPKLARGWNTQQKPSVVLDAMDVYPGRILVLMDVDCTCRGSIDALSYIDGDVGINIGARQARKGRAWQKGIIIVASSRVVVFRPTHGACAFVKEWERLCHAGGIDESRAGGGDETAMAWAYLRCSQVDYAYLHSRYVGQEAGVSAPDAVIVHDSVHDKALLRIPGWTGAKAMLRTFERRFLRTGRTKRDKRVLIAREPHL
jgi:hypothetical protein